MFDIGFSELLLMGVIALVVLGPDKLPGALRTLGLWIGRLRRSFNSIKSEIEREVGADEIRRQLRNEAIMEKIKSTRSQVTESLDSVKKQAEDVKKDLSLQNELDEFKNLTGGEKRPAKPGSEADQGGTPAIKPLAGDEEAGGAGTGSAPEAESKAPRPAAPPTQADEPPASAAPRDDGNPERQNNTGQK